MKESRYNHKEVTKKISEIEKEPIFHIGGVGSWWGEGLVVVGGGGGLGVLECLFQSTVSF